MSVASCFTDSGASRDCTEIGCSDQLTVIVRPAGASFAPGDYEVEVTLDGVANLCTFTIDNTGALANQQCDVFVTLFVAGDSNLQIAYPAAETIDLSIRIDDVEVHAEQATPAYALVAPNGDECPPVCEQAQLDVQL